ncbi:MAG: C39 family peptidase [Anaerolineae bacterium]|nr:C39 family peptidase [Anaerolineae bacterium]
MPLLPISHRPQRQQAECLAACAAMVPDYLNIHSSYDELLKALQIGPAGAPFRNLNFLQSFGVSVLIEQGQIDSLRTYLQQNVPPIAFVATQELSYWVEATNHALVIAGIDDHSVCVNDPSFADELKLLR